MSLVGKLRSATRVAANLRAVQTGRVPQRVANTGLGRIMGRVTRRVWR